MQSLRKGALTRILRAAQAPLQAFRQAVVTRLVAKSPPSDGLGEVLLEYILQDYHVRGRHELAVKWLYALFSSLVQPQQLQQLAGGQGQPSTQPAAAGGSSSSPSSRKRPRPGSDQQEGQDPDHGMDQGQQQATADVDMPEVVDAADAAGSPQQPADESDDHRQQHSKQQEAGGNARPPNGMNPTLQPEQQQQQQQMKGEDAGGPGLARTMYQDVLLALLNGLRERLPPSDRSITRLLLDAPLLPSEDTVEFLQELLEQQGDWATLALATARQLIEGQPPLRAGLLQFVLGAAVAEDSDARAKAVRLICNKLLGVPGLVERILQFAGQQLQLLVMQPANPAASGEQQQQEGEGVAGGSADAGHAKQQPAIAAAAAAAAAAADSSTPASPTVRAGSADHSEPVQAPAASANGTEQQQQEQQQQEQQPTEAEQQPVEGKEEAPALEQPPAELSMEAAEQHCSLYMALCSKQPQLLRPLLEVYGTAGACSCSTGLMSGSRSQPYRVWTVHLMIAVLHLCLAQRRLFRCKVTAVNHAHRPRHAVGQGISYVPLPYPGCYTFSCDVCCFVGGGGGGAGTRS
jgi:hypothetical protein